MFLPFINQVVIGLFHFIVVFVSFSFYETKSFNLHLYIIPLNNAYVRWKEVQKMKQTKTILILIGGILVDIAEKFIKFLLEKKKEWQSWMQEHW